MSTPTPTSLPTAAGRVWAVAAVLALVVYALTADGGPQWQDSGWQQYRITSGTIEHPSGLVLYHPLQYYLGRGLVALNFFEPAFAVTLLSCIAGAVAVANVTTLVALWTGRILPAAFAGLSLGLGHTFWHYASHTETYTLVAALLTTEWLLWTRVLRRDQPGWLPAVAFANGLGVANHLLAILALPVNLVAGVFVCRRTRRWMPLVFATLAWLIGTLPYSLIVLDAWRSSGDLPGTLNSALWGKYRDDVLNAVPALRMLALSLIYIAYNFPGLGLPLAGAAAAKRGRLSSPLHTILLVELAIYLLFVLRYSIPDQYTFFIPAYAILAVLAGFGLDLLTRTNRRWLAILALVTAAWTPLVYIAAAETLRATGQLQSLVGNRPYRDSYRAFLVPWGTQEAGVRDLSRDLFGLAGDDGYVILDAAMIRFALQYEQVLGRGSADVTLMPAKTIRETMSPDEARKLLVDLQQAGRSVVQVPRNVAEPVEVAPGAVWTRHGDLYLLTGWRDDGAGLPE